MRKKNEKSVFIYWVPRSCSRRKLDAEKLSDYFKKNEYKIVDNPKKADYIILVTCAFSRNMAEVSLKNVKKFQRYDAELIVAGCLPGIDKEKLDKIFTGKTVVTKEIEKIDEIFKNNKIKFTQIQDANQRWKNIHWTNPFEFVIKKIYEILPLQTTYIILKEFILKKIYGDRSASYYLIGDSRRKSFYLRISSGCVSNCAYCAIKNAIGPLKSKPLNTCIEEFKKGLKQGYKHFIIAAEDIGSYGIDIQSSLPELLQEILKIKGDYTIEIEEIHPRWLVKYIDEFEKILQKGKIKRICAPIQSGSSRVLKSMNRYYDKEKIKEAFYRLKKSYPELVIGTYFIVGFPSETKNEFQESLDFIIEIYFDWGMAMPFSLKKRTPAEKIEPKIAKSEIENRMKKTFNFFKKRKEYHVHMVHGTDRLLFDKKKKY